MRWPSGLPVTPPTDFGLGFVLDTGLWMYDLMAGRLNVGRHKRISSRETLQRVPTLRSTGLKKALPDTSGDESQSAGDKVSPRIPFWGAGAGFRMAAAAQAQKLTCCVGYRCRANRPTVDTRRCDCRKEPPIETGITAAHSPVKEIEIVLNACCLHGLMIHQRRPLAGGFRT